MIRSVLRLLSQWFDPSPFNPFSRLQPSTACSLQSSQPPKTGTEALGGRPQYAQATQSYGAAQSYGSNPGPNPVITARCLSKQFGQRDLFNIDRLDLHAGEAILLTGRNGAGKSTLMKILAGLEHSDGGQLNYHGIPLSRRHQRRLGGRVIYLHQQPYLFDCRVDTNIGYGLKHLSRDERQHRVQQALQWSGLEHLRERNAKSLSGGEKQRIALARAWVMNPELLLLDEPTANMDAEAREQTLFLIRRLINDGVGVVLCSHEFKGDMRLIRRQLHLEDGRLRELEFGDRPQDASNNNNNNNHNNNNSNCSGNELRQLAPSCKTAPHRYN